MIHWTETREKLPNGTTYFVRQLSASGIKTYELYTD